MKIRRNLMSVVVTGVVVSAMGAPAMMSASSTVLRSAGWSPVSVDHTASAFGVGTQSVKVVRSSPEVAVAYVSADGNTLGQSMKIGGGGLAWRLASRSNKQMGDAEVWWAPTSGARFSVTATPGIIDGSNTQLTVITYLDAVGIGAVASSNGSTGVPTASLTPQTTGGLVGAVGFDWDRAALRTLPPGQTIGAQNTDPLGDTYWAQLTMASTTVGKSVTVGDTAPTNDRWDFAGVEVTAASQAPASTTTSDPPPTTTSTSDPGSTTTSDPGSTTTTSDPPPTTTSSIPATTTTVGTLGLPPGVTTVAVDGGADFYSSHGYAQTAPLDNPSFFPVGVWYPGLNSSSDVAAYKKAGINMLDRPDGNCDLSLLAGTGIYAIPQYGECGGSTGAGITANSSSVVGLFTDDEVDMNEGPGTGYTYLTNLEAAVPASVKAGRIFETNYGKGVQIWETNSQAAEFVNDFQETFSDDFYWMTDSDINSAWSAAPWNQCAQFYGLNTNCTTDQAQRGSNYGSAIDNERSMENPVGSEPIWTFVEDGCPSGSGNACITPAQMQWSVWSSIIHGARGVIYFNHSFTGACTGDNNLESSCYATIAAQMKTTDATIASQAAALNDRTALGYVTATPTASNFAGIETLTKYHGGQFTIFADTRDSGTVQNIPATFHLADSAATSVTVVGENRTIPVTGGTFTDTFATGSAVHIYAVND